MTGETLASLLSSSRGIYKTSTGLLNDLDYAQSYKRAERPLTKHTMLLVTSISCPFLYASSRVTTRISAYHQVSDIIKACSWEYRYRTHKYNSSADTHLGLVLSGLQHVPGRSGSLCREVLSAILLRGEQIREYNLTLFETSPRRVEGRIWQHSMSDKDRSV